MPDGVRQDLSGVPLFVGLQEAFLVKFLPNGYWYW